MFSEEKKKHHFRERAKHFVEKVGFHEDLLPHIARHLHHFARGGSPVIWIQGQNCTGCSVSHLNSDHFAEVDLGYGKMSLRYQPDLMAASGYQATNVIEETEEEGRRSYLLVVEGAIPTGEGADFCTFGVTDGTKEVMGRKFPADRTIQDWLEELIPGAAAVLAIGNCASFGGVPAANAEVTNAKPVSEIVATIDEEKPVVNVAGCPPHPDWLMGSLLDVLLWITGDKGPPELNENRCLERFYRTTIHENCERREAFENKRFLLDWNDLDPSENLCLLKLGCRGMKTHGDCPTRRWNEAINWCVGTNSPCQGCTEPGFYNRLPHQTPKSGGR